MSQQTHVPSFRRSENHLLAACFSKLMTDNVLPNYKNVKGADAVETETKAPRCAGIVA